MKSMKVFMFVVALAIFGLTSVAQETRTIRGKVKPQKKYDCGNQELGWTNITVKLRSRGQTIQPNPQRSKNEDWSHPKAPVGANVSIGFFHNCYRPWRIPSYDVSSAASQTLPVVALSPMDVCSRCPSSKPANKVIFRTGGGAQSTNAAIAEVEVPTPEVPKAAESKPSAAELRTTLKEDAATALEFDSLDVFQYNFAVLQLAYANTELAVVLNEFKTSPENSAFFTGFGAKRSAAFRNIIEKPLLGKGTFDPAAAIELLAETSVDSSIRGSAVVALLDSKLNSDQTTKLRDRLRKNAEEKSSDIYLTSVIALARIGSTEDRQKIADDVKSPDSDIAIAALNAIRVAQITDNTNPFGWTVPTIAEIATSSKDPELRQAAILALRPAVYYYRRVIALRALTSALQRDVSSEVRAAAADALGLGRLEMRLDVRFALIRAIQTDLSNAVRTAADNSLTGRAQ